MNGPLLLDLSHTSHTAARTGIQRVARGLQRSLGEAAWPVVYDPFGQAWRGLDPTETARLALESPARGRSAHWTWNQRCRGRLRRWLRRPAPPLPAIPAGFIAPEIFSPRVAAALPTIFRHVAGPRIALFNDAIALQRPEWAPPATAARFPGYLRELAAFDGVAAISAASRDALLGYWSWLGLRDTPPVAAIPLGVDPPPSLPMPAAVAEEPPVVLCVATIEARKNHLALLDACETLWLRGLRFQLRLIGLARPETGGPALARIAALQAAGRSLRFDGPVNEAGLEAAYAEAAFTVYPSLWEGFGLPVAESLRRGKPCVCSATGALGEVSRDGGCLTLETPDAPSLAEACATLLRDKTESMRLADAARRRHFPTPAAYAADLISWMKTLLPRRS